MFVEPEVTESKVATKADPSAPARSAIRRQRTVRYTPHTRDRFHRDEFRARDQGMRASNEALSRELHQRRMLRYFSRRNGPENAAAELAAFNENEERRNGILERDRLSREEERREASRADRERHAASQHQRMESGRALLRDALSYERPGQRMRLSNNPNEAYYLPGLEDMSESAQAAYAEIVQRARENPRLTSEERRMVQRELSSNQHALSPPPRNMPTPPSSSEEHSNQLAALESTPPVGSAEYTARFAPSRYHELFHRDETRLREHAQGDASTTALLDEVESARRETIHSLEEADRTIEAANRALSELPPLRRMPGRRSHLPSPPENRPTDPLSQPTVDGLGDRSRSFSPEDDAWDTLLSTMTPDERVPSVHSSFTSATASASASSSLAPNSATNSYGTLVTAPSSNTSTADLYPTLCENTDSEDSLTEEEDMQPEPSSALTHPRPRPVYSLRYTTRDRSEQTLDLNPALTPAERTLADQEARFRMMRARERVRERELESIRGEREAELQRIQADLDRLDRQVPDHWYEEAGIERRAGRERL